MHSLLDGVQRFRSNIQPAKQELFNELATGQSPAVLFITCADSRIDPSLITQTDPGEIFVVRNAGNIVPPSGSLPAGSDGTVASVEFAIQALKVTEVVVCGHSDCGAMKGALAPESVTALPQVAGWIKFSEPAVVGLATDDVDTAIERNVLLQLENLRSYPVVSEAIERGELTLSGWVYDIGQGEVRVFNGNEFSTTDLASA